MRKDALTKEAVLAYLTEHLKETDGVVEAMEALEQLAISLLGAHEREWVVDELGDEVHGSARFSGSRIPAVPTRDEVQTLLQVPDNPRDALMFRVLYSAGLRVSELTKLLFADIQCSEQSLFIRAGKGDKDRYAMIDALTADQLAQWQGEQGPQDRAFPIGDRQVERIVKEWGKATGLFQKYDAMDRDLTTHSFRHAFATHCYEDGMDLFTLKSLMGHQYLDTTEGYIETSINKWRSAYLAAHPLAQKPPDRR